MSRSILITGANGALGLAIAEFFLTREEDCRVFLGVRERRERAQALAARFSDRAHLLTLEITAPDDWKAALIEIENKAAPLGVLVNNVAGPVVTRVGREPERRLSRLPGGTAHHDAGATGAHHQHLLTQRHFLTYRTNQLRRSQGWSDRPDAEFGQRISPHGHHRECNLPRLHRGWAAGRLRFARPGEIAAAVFFLASTDASYITGSTLKIDGGLL
jgi:3-oxoacyl-[acyl-carrier protein] reductase